MKGRRRETPGVSEESPLPEQWSPRDLDQRPQDGPATFAMTRVDRPSRRDALPAIALVGLAVGLIGVGMSARPAPTTVGRMPASAARAAASQGAVRNKKRDRSVRRG